MPFKSSLMRSAGKLFGVSNQEDLDLRGKTAETRWIAPITSTGGTIINDGTTRYHVFLADGTFTCDQEVSGAKILLIGSGARGGGGRAGSGGGGAGGVFYSSNGTIPAAPHSFTVADISPATGEPHPGRPGEFYGAKGGDTTAFGLTALAGGGGDGAFYTDAPTALKNGGSGGGGGVGYPSTGYSGGAAQGSTTTNPFGEFTFYGNDGGQGNPYTPPTTYAGAGGGGSGGAGGDGSPTDAGDGGAGQAFPEFPAPVIAPAIPSPVRSDWTSAVGPTGTFAGGGGGGCTSGSDGNQGSGSAGGGRGGYNDPVDTAVSAVNYTGSGGGAGEPGKQGSAGIIMLKFTSVP